MCRKTVAEINSSDLGAGHAVRCAEADWSANEGFEPSNI